MNGRYGRTVPGPGLKQTRESVGVQEEVFSRDKKSLSDASSRCNCEVKALAYMKLSSRIDASNRT